MASKRRRDHKAEYRRRIELGAKRGLSRSAARGHKKPGELGAAEKRQLQRAAKSEYRRSFLRQKAAARVAELAEVSDVWDDLQDGDPGEKNNHAERTRRSSSAERFVDRFVELGLGTEHEAWSLWFSP